MTILSKTEPFVILLDLDQTIQGDVGPQLQEYQFIKYLNEEVVNKSKRLLQNKQDVIKDMKEGLLRPHFKRFIVKMKQRYPTCEFFIYTASEDSWGKYIASIIQETIQVKFNKRIFTRSDCIYNENKNGYMKSIEKVSPFIYSELKRKGYELKGNKKNYQFNNIFLIDNSNVLYPNELKHLLKCDDYKGKVYVDCLRNIPNSFIKKHFKQIGQYLLQETVSNEIDLYRRYYAQLHFMNTYQLETNQHINRKDKFWKHQLKKLKRTFTY